MKRTGRFLSPSAGARSFVWCRILALTACAAPVLANPTLEWSKPIDSVVAVAVDSEGNTYVASSVPQAQHCPTSTLQTPDVCPDVLVTKLDTKGNVVYSTTFGGSAHDLPSAIAVDAARNAYIAGSTDSNDFPLVHPAVPRPPATFSVYHTFVVKLSADGQTVLYSTVYGGSGQDVGTSIAVDWLGNAYVAGATTSVDLPTMSAFQQLTAASALVKSTDAGGTFHPIGRTAAADRLISSPWIQTPHRRRSLPATMAF